MFRTPLVTTLLAVGLAVPSAMATVGHAPENEGDYVDPTRDISAATFVSCSTPGPCSAAKATFTVYFSSAGDNLAPGIELDRNRDGKVERLVGRPPGMGAGVYNVKGTALVKIGAARYRQITPTQGIWKAAKSLVASKGKIRWRAVSYTAEGERADLAPNKGFVTTAW